MTQRFWEVRAASAARDTWVGMVDVSRRSDVVLAERVALGDLPSDPIDLEVLNRGSRRGDLLHATGERIVVASESFVRVLAEVGAAGWRSVPVKIRYKNGDELPGYRLLVTTGRCADFRIDRGDDDDTEEAVDVSVGWDGSDVFWWEAPGWSFLVTDRVKRAIEDACLEGVQFEVPMR